MKVMTHKEKHETAKKEVQEGEIPSEAAIPTAEEWDALRKELMQAQAQAAENLDGWKRAQAEFANYRKRQEREGSEQLVQAMSRVASRWFPVLEDLERALRDKPTPETLEQWTNGLDLVYRKGLAILEQEGITAIEVAPGQEFDPLLHEAVTHEPCADHEDGEIIGVVRGGYRLGDRVLRPVQVRVACQPAATGE
jgi:molecular chaperone GrpE